MTTRRCGATPRTTWACSIPSWWRACPARTCSPRPSWSSRYGLAAGPLEQPAVQVLEVGAGGDPELVAEQDPQPLVGAERLGEVAPPLPGLAGGGGAGP